MKSIKVNFWLLVLILLLTLILAPHVESTLAENQTATPGPAAVLVG